MNAKWDVSVSFLLISSVNLQLGDPIAARRELEQSNPWAAAVPENADFQSAKDFLEMSLRFERQGDVLWRIEGFEAARAHYEKAINLLEKGLQRPKVTKLRIRRQLARCYLSLADAYLRLNRDAPSAVTHYQHTTKNCEELLTDDAEDTETKALLAEALYKHGVAAVRESDLPQSEVLFQKCLQLRQEIAETAPQDMLRQAELMMALARRGLHQEALVIAATVRERFDEPIASYLVGRCYAVCAGSPGVAPPAGLPPEPDRSSLPDDLRPKAVAALSKALRNGWKDLRSLETDPDLENIDLTPLLKGAF